MIMWCAIMSPPPICVWVRAREREREKVRESERESEREGGREGGRESERERRCYCPRTSVPSVPSGQVKRALHARANARIRLHSEQRPATHALEITWCGTQHLRVR